MEIFDMLGNETVLLLSSYLTAGNYKVTFDGEKLPSGVYFYQLIAGKFVQSKKMLLLK